MKYVTLILLLSILIVQTTNTTEYPRTMIVTEVDIEADLVTLEDNVGFEWQFYGVEDWEVNDICSCIMSDNGTEIITDDSIVMTRYNGNLSK